MLRPMNRIPLRIGVDTGGTFTDLVALGDDGVLRVHKLRSTPHDPAEAILEGIRKLAAEQACTLEVIHGSTVATNAVLERRGARIALLATAGFEDVLRIGRQTRRELYNFQVEAPRPLVEPELTFGVRERMLFDGTVLQPLESVEIARLLDLLKASQVNSVAVCLLHSYANAAHEEALAGALTAAGFQVSASHRILPEYREFERWSTTAMNAYVTPLMAAYLARLQKGLVTDASLASLRIMQSNGGSISAQTASQAAVQTILSGPAAGVVGAQAMAAASGFRRVITFDMGGTSTDVALIDGHIGTTSDSFVGDLPLRLPVLDIHTVGAGGGSVAWVDSAGALRVGPRSAGADPGPACYGQGDELTVTDANLLLGRLDPEFFLGGRMRLDLARTRLLAEALAERLGVTPQALAEGILRIANSNMARAIRVVSVQRGFDPRDFALLAFGGAGGLHACALAESLDIPTVLVPEHSGVLSALGMLLADVQKDYSASVLQPTASLTEHGLHERLQPLLAEARISLQLEGFEPADILLEPSLDMRYQGQAYEIRIAFEPDFAEAFHRAHARLYGYANPARATEVVQLRLKATGRTEKPNLMASDASGAPGDTKVHPTAVRQAIFHGRGQATPVFHRDHLLPGHGATGPALVLTAQSTNVIAPGWAWKIDQVGTLVVTRQQQD
jgi:N-methylhydantoinase A/oxoprolinase/acetone carboxylase beta subunit